MACYYLQCEMWFDTQSCLKHDFVYLSNTLYCTRGLLQCSQFSEHSMIFNSFVSHHHFAHWLMSVIPLIVILELCVSSSSMEQPGHCSHTPLSVLPRVLYLWVHWFVYFTKQWFSWGYGWWLIPLYMDRGGQHLMTGT